MEIPRTEKLKSWNSLPDHVRKWILKLTGDKKVIFKRVSKKEIEEYEQFRKNNEPIQLTGNIERAEGKQGQLF
jgi:hypothetical protein